MLATSPACDPAIATTKVFAGRALTEANGMHVHSTMAAVSR